MRSVYRALARLTTLTIALAVINSSADAYTYLAVNSGSYSKSATWGDVAPAHLAIGDEIIIPAGVTVTMDADVNINGKLTLDGSVLDLNGHNLNFGKESDLEIQNSGAIRSNPYSGISIESISGFTNNLTFTPESKIGNLTINTNAREGVYLGSDIIIAGVLNLQSGILYLNNHELYIAGNGDFLSEDAGVISSTSLSDIGIFANNNLSSPLRFSPQGNTVRNFTVNCYNEENVVRVDANLYVTGSLVLASGKLDMGDQKMTLMHKSTAVAHPNSYVANSGKRKSRDARRSERYFTANAAR